MGTQLSRDDVLDDRLRRELSPEAIKLIEPEALSELFQLLVSRGREEEFAPIAEFMGRVYDALAAQNQEIGVPRTLEDLERAESAISSRGRRKRRILAAPGTGTAASMAADSQVGRSPPAQAQGRGGG